jgi:hypothetical protein
MSSVLGVVNAVILGVAAVLMSPGVRADVIQMTDGRRFAWRRSRLIRS